MPGVMSALGTMAKDAGKSAIGMVDKAMILIVDERGVDKSAKTIVQAGKKGKKSRDTGDITEKLRKKNDFRTRDLKGVEAEKVLKREQAQLNKQGISRNRVLHVQFNPSSLKLNARGGGRTAQMTYDAKGNGKMINAGVNGRIDFSVQLIFDRVNNQDAFMNEKFVLNPTAIAKGIITGIKGEKYEVRTEVEGFLAALNNNTTRNMEFIWGHLIYKGKLNSVNATYTMFNVSGQPIRAIVDLSMCCTEPYANNSNLAMWDARYRATFIEEDKEGQARGKDIKTNMAYQKKVQSLLNL